MLEARAHRLIEGLRRAEPTEADRNFPFKVQPFPYQLRIFAAARHMTSMALAPVAPGTGKTKMLIDIAAAKFEAGDIDCVAVIASPRGVHRQWVEKALPEHMSPVVKYRAAVWKSTRKTDPKVMKEDFGRLRWLTFNVEAFSGESGKAAKELRAFMKSGRCFLIEDESSRIKSYKAERTKAILKLAPEAACRAILTGTPLTKGLEDLWAQYEFLDPTILGMSNYFAFRARYCVTVPAYRGAALGAVKIIGYRNMEEFVRKIAPVTFVVPKDVLGLPEKTREELPVELTPEQRKAYNALRDKLVDDLQEQKIASPVNAAVRLVRLQQVLSGRVYEPSENEDEPPICRLIPSLRVATLVEFIAANDEPYVIWARFKTDILEIEAALRKAGRNPVTYYGDTSDDARAQAIRDMQSGKASDFVGNPATAGMGIDGLQHVCQRAIYFSNSYNREHRWQSEDRIHRIGMRGTAWYGDMVAAGTVDRMILGSYKKTEDLVREVMTRPELIPTLNEE